MTWEKKCCTSLKLHMVGAPIEQIAVDTFIPLPEMLGKNKFILVLIGHRKKLQYTTAPRSDRQAERFSGTFIES